MKDEENLQKMKGIAGAAPSSLPHLLRAVSRFYKSPFTVAAEGQGSYESQSRNHNPTCRVRMAKDIVVFFAR